MAHQWSKMAVVKAKKKVYCNTCRKKLSSTNTGVFCEGEREREGRRKGG